MMRIMQAALACVAVMISAGQLKAGTVFSDRSVFESTITGLSFQGFNTDFDNSFGPIAFDDFTVTGNNLPNSFRSGTHYRYVSEGARAFRFTSQNTLGGTLVTFTFDNPVTAFAIDINDWGFERGYQTFTQPWLLRAFNDTQTVDVDLAEMPPALERGNTIFFGYMDSQPFQAMTLFSNSDGDAIGLDNLLYGTPPVVAEVASVPAPEPGSLAIFAIGAIGVAIGGARRRRRQSVAS